MTLKCVYFITQKICIKPEYLEINKLKRVELTLQLEHSITFYQTEMLKLSIETYPFF